MIVIPTSYIVVGLICFSSGMLTMWFITNYKFVKKEKSKDEKKE